MTARPNSSSCASTSTIRCSSRCSPRRSPTRPQTLPAELRADARLVFTAHSIPLAAAIPLRHGPLRPPGRLRVRGSSRPRRDIADYDQVWQSRSGPPQVPWLEPDVADHLSALADAGTKAVDRLSDRLRRRPHRGGVGSGQRAARTGGTTWASRSPGGHPQRRPPVRAAGRRSDRRATRWPRPVPVREHARHAKRLRCTAFRSMGRCARPTAGSPSPPGRLQDRADRGQPGRAHDRGQADAAPRWRSAPPTSSAARSASIPN